MQNSLEGNEINKFKNFVLFLIDIYQLGIKLTSDNFYNNIAVLINDIRPIVVAKTIRYFRYKAGPHYVISLLQVILMFKLPTRKWGKKFYSSIVRNPGDIIEVFDILMEKNLKPTNAMKNGYAFKFENFSENDLSGYLNVDGEVTLIDIVRLIHPKHTPAIGSLMNNSLIPYDQEKEKVNFDFIKEVQELAYLDIKELYHKVAIINFR
jgi:hypothetical protein